MRLNGQEVTRDSRAQAYAKQLREGIGQAGLKMTIRYLEAHGLNRAITEHFSLGYVAHPEPGDERFAGRLVIPYLTRGGVAALKYRCVSDHDCHNFGHAKYDQPDGQPVRVYNPEAYFRANGVIGITEGEIDAIAASERLAIPSIGLPGASTWANPQYARILKITLRDYDNVLIFTDGDAAGLSFARGIAADVPRRSKLVKCPAGMDVSSMVAAGRGGELREKAGL